MTKLSDLEGVLDGGLATSDNHIEKQRQDDLESDDDEDE